MRQNGKRLRAAAVCFLAVLLFLCISGCAGKTAPAAAQEAYTIVSHNFSHAGYVDSIAFLLPAGWSCESYEKMNAGEGMDTYEWGFDIYIDGREEAKVSLSGSRREPESETAWGTPEAVQTGAGVTGERYIRQIVGADGESSREYLVLFDEVSGSSASYRIFARLPEDIYQQYRQALDVLTAGISIVGTPKEE